MMKSAKSLLILSAKNVQTLHELHRVLMNYLYKKRLDNTMATSRFVDSRSPNSYCITNAVRLSIHCESNPMSKVMMNSPQMRASMLLLIMSNIECGGVCLDHPNTVSTTPNGLAVVMLQSNGQNAIIVVGDGNGSIHASAQYSRPMHEIIFSSDDKPKLLSQLTCLLSKISVEIL